MDNRQEAEDPLALGEGYRALRDAVVGRSLRLLHDEPARPWTVATRRPPAG